MHIPQERLSATLGELRRISSREIIIVEETLGNSPPQRTTILNDYTYIHAYEHIILEQGIGTIKEKKIFRGLVDLICLVIDTHG